MTQRECGSCTLCCKLLPVNNGGFHADGSNRPATWSKPAGERCHFQRHGKGCAIYDRRPLSCRLWTCRWLVNDQTARLSRPDRSHYVIDTTPDFITVTEDQKDGSREVAKLEVVQIWCDPKHPDAHEDPELRRYLERRGEEGIVALIRYNAREGFVLFPPALCSDGKFHERHHGIAREQRPVEEWAAGLEEARREREEAPDGPAQA